MVIGLSSGTPSLRTIRTMSFGLLSSAASRWVIFFSTGVVCHLVAVPLVRDERSLNNVFLNCLSVKIVWLHFASVLSLLLGNQFVANLLTVFFFRWPSLGA